MLPCDESETVAMVAEEPVDQRAGCLAIDDDDLAVGPRCEQVPRQIRPDETVPARDHERR